MATTKQPYCLIIGGGQGGIALGARLKQLGVPTIIVEKNARAGDSWRNRYRSLVLHDPVWYDHLPYIPFPDNWPVFTPKDKLGDWLEMYVKRDGARIIGHPRSACAPHTTKASQEWTVEVGAKAKRCQLRPKQLVFATGAYGPPNELALAGADEIRGRDLSFEPIRRAASRTRARPASSSAPTALRTTSPRTSGNSAPTVAMLQRSPTTVVRSETLMELGFEALYSEKAVASRASRPRGPISCSPRRPFASCRASRSRSTSEIRKRDAAFYARLAEVRLPIRLRRGRVRTDDEGDAHRLRLLYRRRRLGARRQRRHQGAQRGRNLAGEGPVGRAHGRFRAARRSHCARDRISVDEPRRRADRLGGSGGQRWGNAGGSAPASPTIRARGRASRATCGSRRNSPASGSTAAISTSRAIISLFLALQLKARMEGLPTPVYGLQKVHHKS